MFNLFKKKPFKVTYSADVFTVCDGYYLVQITSRGIRNRYPDYIRTEVHIVNNYEDAVKISDKFCECGYLANSTTDKVYSNSREEVYD